MISEIMLSIKNHFARERTTGELFGYESNHFTLADGKISVRNKYLVNSFVAITGSILNNGVYRVEDFADGVITIKESDANDKLTSESFEGTIYSLRVPQNFLQLVKEIEEFNKSEFGKASNITSASFGVQSFGFGTNSSGVRATWEDAFRQRLNKHRRYTPDIVI